MGRDVRRWSVSGADGLTVPVMRAGVVDLLFSLIYLFGALWSVRAEFRDAMLVPEYKNGYAPNSGTFRVPVCIA